MTDASRRTQHARQLFAPLGPTYDRYASLFSFGQDPRWRRFLVSCIPPDARVVLDVACGTGAVAIELARRVRTRTVTGVDQSAEMLASGRARVEAAGLTKRIALLEGRAEALPFGADAFEALTFTYLLRYVDDPRATLAELGRVVRSGGTVAMLEFGLPRWPWRAAWEAYVRVGLPAAGYAVGPEWATVGRFLGPSITRFYRELPLSSLVELWRATGFADVRVKHLSFGAGIVVSGVRI